MCVFPCLCVEPSTDQEAVNGGTDNVTEETRKGSKGEAVRIVLLCKTLRPSMWVGASGQSCRWVDSCSLHLSQITVHGLFYLVL